MKKFTRNLVLVSALALISCGATSSGAGVWSGDQTEDFGMTWYGIGVLANNGVVDPNPSLSKLKENEGAAKSYFSVSFNCSLDFADKYIAFNNLGLDFDDEDIPAILSFDDDVRETVTLQGYSPRLDFDDENHRKALKLFAQSRKTVEILVNNKLVNIPMNGFQRAYEKMPKDCQMDKEFTLGQMSKAEANSKLFKQRRQQYTVDGFVKAVKKQFEDPEGVKFRNSKIYTGTSTVCTEASQDGASWLYFIYDDTAEKLVAKTDDKFETLDSLCGYGGPVDLLKPLVNQNL